MSYYVSDSYHSLQLREAEAAFPRNNNNNNNNIGNGLMINSTAKCLGTTCSKFNPTTAQMLFCWELTAAEVSEILRNGSGWPCSVKEIEFYSDALYRTQFSLEMAPSGAATVKAEITRESYPETTPANASIYFILNSCSKMYGPIIPRNIFADVVEKHGTIEIYADLNPPDENDNLENNDELPENFENDELPEI